MNQSELYHYGVLGMKWGVRKKSAPRKNSSKISSSNIQSVDKPSKKKAIAKGHNIKEWSDDELRAKINRLELEKKYKDLSSAENRKQTSKGKAFVMEVLEKSGKNIASQTMTYAMGTMVNKVAGTNIVNPKKGQKDK